jgi:hypothetical protein
MLIAVSNFPVVLRDDTKGGVKLRRLIDGVTQNEHRQDRRPAQ